MNIFIDGLQVSGKTTLIESLPYKHYRFSFDKYFNGLDLYDKNSLNGFQLGKDLGILFGLNTDKSNGIKIFDRGPFSTLYYSLLDNRMTDKQIDEFLNLISEFDNCKYIFIKKSNIGNQSRDKSDGFDYLFNLEGKSDEVINKIVELAKSHNIEIKIFTNDFSSGIIDNVNRFKELIKECARSEYIGSYC